ncbi:ABC-type transport auxiliary lipoprotein family protein [Guyparkeria hydrothermalis]|uniref:ABC-type transport auxiliary lipoprotein family protein n=1 Tax=Guyparkeria hydrothermalis TaxID=923 RepID=UPI002021343E|nr:ABC-type transport auxiliary lipoprotein family protein [Guyparkeria hydrothermalis]MCL7743784.1 ABC-type transport auxiliary lipoprotein family protein [Guyparkeria hydrothermalis]
MVKNMNNIPQHTVFMGFFIPSKGRGLLGFMAVMLATALAGCSILPKPAGEPDHWRLVAPSLEEKGDFDGAPVVLRLIEPRANSAIDRRDMAYSRTPQSLAYYRDNRWIASPAVMLDEIIDETLSAQPWVRNVMRGGGRVSTDLALYCEVQQLEHQVEYVDGRVQLKAACSWYRGENRKLIETLQFDQAVDIDRNDAPHYAAGAQELVADFMRALTRQGRALAAAGGEAGGG